MSPKSQKFQYKITLNVKKHIKNRLLFQSPVNKENEIIINVLFDLFLTFVIKVIYLVKLNT